MKYIIATALLVAGVLGRPLTNTTDTNPFIGKNYYANSGYAAKLETTIKAFLAKNDTLNAARVKTVQKTGTFVWVTTVSGLGDIDKTIAEARAEQLRTSQEQIVQLVLYDLPDRDCSGGASGGEFSSTANGLELYKTTFVDSYASRVKSAPDLTFAIILEPDSLGNAITNQNVPFCANASTIYEEGIAYAISQLQAPHISLYVDAAHGGWLGWDGNLGPGMYEIHMLFSLLTLYSCRRICQSRRTCTEYHCWRYDPWVLD
jgi:cellulose 1,4-beta-cellobiosidase